MPSGESAGIVVANPDLVRLSNVDHLTLDLIDLSCLEVVAFVLKFYLIRLDRLSLFVLSVGDEVNIGISATAASVRRVNADEPSLNWTSKTK